jgi:hypothetical protein
MTCVCVCVCVCVCAHIPFLFAVPTINLESRSESESNLPPQQFVHLLNCGVHVLLFCPLVCTKLFSFTPIFTLFSNLYQ